MGSEHDCKDVGETNSDVGGLGIVLGTIIQCGLSMVCAIYYLCIDFAHPTGISEATPPVASKGVKTRRILHQILKALSVTQWILGFSLLVATLAQGSHLSVYHWRVTYECIVMVIAAATAALLCGVELYDSKKDKNPRLYEDSRSMIWFFLTPLFFGMVVMAILVSVIFGTKLWDWNDDLAGKCYTTVGLARPYASHPKVDGTYVGMTATTLVLEVFACVFTVARATKDVKMDRGLEKAKKTMLRAQRPSKEPLPHHVRMAQFKAEQNAEALLKATNFTPSSLRRMKVLVFVPALVLYIVSVYMVMTLRAHNVPRLKRSYGDTENSWGFGQIVAITSLLAVIYTACDAIRTENKGDPEPIEGESPESIDNGVSGNSGHAIQAQVARSVHHVHHEGEDVIDV